MTMYSLAKSRLDDLFGLLTADGFELVGPRIEQEAIIYGRISSVSDLPVGWTDRQGPGWYRLEKRTDDALFGYAVGPHSWKKYVFPSELRLWTARQSAHGFDVDEIVATPPKRAFIGIRSCELHALAIQDRVFMDRDGRWTDPYYAAARNRVFLVAVECTEPGGTCFCASAGTGPDVRPESIGRKEKVAPSHFETNETQRIPLTTCSTTPAADASVCDIIMTELTDSFVIRSASAAGERILEKLKVHVASADEVADAHDRVSVAARKMGRTLDLAGVRELLHGHQEHAQWDDIANRCLACTNCTMVCPTCFCSSVSDVTDLDMESSTRVRQWDSCFNPEFAAVHGGNFRASIKGRYRQWLTHKFASWIDQFGISGCVGCGRCITWCPVGIDVTQEISAIRSNGEQAKKVVTQ